MIPRKMTEFGAVAALAAVMAAGCSAPTLEVTHRLHPPVAIDCAYHRQIGDAGFDIHLTGNAAGTVDAERLRQSLANQAALAAATAPCRTDGPAGEGSFAGAFGGEAFVQINDIEGERTVLTGLDEDGPEQVLPTLVRRAKVRVVFRVKHPDGPWVHIETRSEYDSRNDPQLRGAADESVTWGLLRGDDPRRIPPAEEILQRQIEICCETFADMLAPTIARARIPLRPVGPDALDLVREDRLSEAATAFEQQLQARPEDADLRFNLAACQEATGQLAPALENYRRVAEAEKDSRESPTPAESAERRVGRLLQRWDETCETEFRVLPPE